MATYFELLSHRNHPVEAIFAATDIAEENRVKECDAATKIQSAARMRRCRARFVHVRRCVIDVQRAFRGFLGRRRFYDIAVAAAEVTRLATYHHFATVIQARFRGFYSRKWKSDFFAQKRYLHDVVMQGERVRREAAEAQEAQRLADAARVAEEQRVAFRSAAGGMHHLLSTAVRSGILRPVGANTGHTTIFGTNVEDELRAVPIPRRKFKEELTTLKAASAGGLDPHRAGGTAVLNPTVGKEPYTKSLQASPPYDIARAERELERAVHDRLVSSVHGKTFAPRHATRPPEPLSLNAGCEFIDPRSAVKKLR